MLLRQLKLNLGLINANIYPLAVAKSKPDLRLAKGRFKFRGPVTPGDGSGAASDKPNGSDEYFQPSNRLPVRASKNTNLQPSSEKNVFSYFAHEVYALPICAPNEQLTDRRRKRVLAANPAPDKSVRSKWEREAAVRVKRFVQ